jgi:hypothetical protein
MKAADYHKLLVQTGGSAGLGGLANTWGGARGYGSCGLRFKP